MIARGTFSRRGLAVVLGLSWLAGFSAGAAPYELYVSNERSGDVSVIDGATQEVTRVLPAGKRPRGIHVSPDGHTLYVATSGSPRMGPGSDPERAGSLTADKSADGIAVIDLIGTTGVRHLVVGSDPEEFALSRDGRRVVVANEDIATASIWEIADGKFVAKASVTGEPEGVALHPLRDEVYVTCEEDGDVFVLHPMTGREIARIALGGRPRTIAFSPDGTLAYVPLETANSVAIVDTTTHQLVERVALTAPGLPMGSAISPDGRELYVTTGRANTVAVMDTVARTFIANIPVGGRPWGVALSPDGTYLYTANGATDDVSVIHVRTRKEVRRIKVNAGPWGIAVNPRPPRPLPPSGTP
jgi:YVTN family beta-propeller protein